MRAGPGAAGLGPSTGRWPQGPVLLLLWCWVNNWQEQAGCSALAGLAVLTCPASTNLGPSVGLQGLPGASRGAVTARCMIPSKGVFNLSKVGVYSGPLTNYK